ncbi:hypothetical protein [Rathayibacter tanaceti]|uniref:Uncharacterized protein n=1 Tax=Rathayibacter tanaceti TaxID=1671680 RepID=A0AAE6RHY4_9MICO|nr:hypothetical protein [Rathayibacter tanaceti]QHC54341.1 hypothetical protein GSU10_00790 [Rathayibacter tanaceti]
MVAQQAARLRSAPRNRGRIAEVPRERAVVVECVVDGARRRFGREQGGLDRQYGPGRVARETADIPLAQPRLRPLLLAHLLEQARERGGGRLEQRSGAHGPHAATRLLHPSSTLEG